MKRLSWLILAVSFGSCATYCAFVPHEKRLTGEASFKHGVATWGNGACERWPYLHQRIITEERDWELAANRFGLPILPLPVVMAFEQVGDDLVAIQVNRMSDGVVLWRR